MAQKRRSSPPKHAPSTSSSEDDAESEESEEQLNTKTTPLSSPNPKKPTIKQPSQPSSSSSSSTSDSDGNDEPANEDEDDEDDTDNDSETEKPKPTQSTPGKPTSNSKPSKKTLTSPPNSPPPPPPAAKSPSVASSKKRLADADPPSSKTPKKRTGDLFQKIWTEEDEITILKGLIDFHKDQPSHFKPFNLTKFYEFISNSTGIHMERHQIGNKVRRFKDKLRENFKKETSGKDVTFKGDHERECFELSKKIWGNEFKNDVGGKKRVTAGNASEKKKVVSEGKSPARSPAKTKSTVATMLLKLAENSDGLGGGGDSVSKLKLLYPNLSETLRSGLTASVLELGESNVNRAFGSMDHSRLKEWDERLVALRAKERDLGMEWATLSYEIVRQCYDHIKVSSKH